MLLKKMERTWFPLGSRQLLLNISSGAWLLLDDKCKQIASVMEDASSIEDVFNAFPEVSPIAIIDLLQALNENYLRAEETKKKKCEENCHEILPQLAVVKMAEGCNLHCSYCYINAESKNKALMSEKIALKVVDEFLKMHEMDDEKFCYAFHGGEPLLNFELIKKVVEYIRPYRDKITLSIQTNGTLVTEEIAKFFKENDFSVGISIDGPKDLHDLSRHYANGVGSFDRTLRGIKILQEQGVDVGTISVINRENAKQIDRVLDFFIENKIKNLSFSPMQKNGRGKDRANVYVDENILFEAYKIIIKRIVAYNKMHKRTDWIYERDLTNLVKSVYFNQKHFMCMDAPCGAGRRILGIDVHGDIYICDNFTYDKDFLVGSIFDGNLKEQVLASEKRKIAASRSFENLKRCKDCIWRGLCAGICFSSDYYSGARGVEETEVCRFYKKIIPYLIEQIDENPDLPYLIDPSIKRNPSRNVYVSLDSSPEDEMDLELFEALLKLHQISYESSVYLCLKNFEKCADLKDFVELLQKRQIDCYIVCDNADISTVYDNLVELKARIFHVNFEWWKDGAERIQKLVEYRRKANVKLNLNISVLIHQDDKNEDFLLGMKESLLPDDKIFVSAPDSSEESFNALNEFLKKATCSGIEEYIFINSIDAENLLKENYMYLLRQVKKDHDCLWIDCDDLMGKELKLASVNII